jgi:hypothetical protein
MARSNELMLHREAGYMNATGFKYQSTYLAQKAGSIHEPPKLDSEGREDWTSRAGLLEDRPWHGTGVSVSSSNVRW